MSLFTKFVLARGFALPAKISAPNAATAVQSASSRKASGNHASRDEHRAQRSQEELAKMMKVDMKNLGSPEVQALSDADIAKIITDGKGKMKPVKSVTGPAVDNVVAYVRTLKK